MGNNYSLYIVFDIWVVRVSGGSRCCGGIDGESINARISRFSDRSRMVFLHRIISVESTIKELTIVLSYYVSSLVVKW